VLRGKVAAHARGSSAALQGIKPPLGPQGSNSRRGRGKGRFKQSAAARRAACSSAEEAFESSQKPARHKLITISDGPEGKTVNRVFVEEGCKIAASCIWHRPRPPAQAGADGFHGSGAEIEKVAAETPHLDS